MVDLCNFEHLTWTTLTICVAIIAAFPWPIEDNNGGALKSMSIAAYVYAITRPDRPWCMNMLQSRGQGLGCRIMGRATSSQCSVTKRNQRREDDGSHSPRTSTHPLFVSKHGGDSCAHSPPLNPLLEHGKLMKPRASIRPSAEDGAGLSKWLLIDVPKKLFTHFYAFGFLTSTAVLVDVFFRGGAMITAEIQKSSICSRHAARHVQSRELGVESLVCLVLLTVQLGRRLWECLAVTRWGSSRMHLGGYLLGILFYQLMLLTVLVEAPPLGSLVQGMGLFDSGWKDALNLGQEMVQSMKIRHAVALGAFLVGSMRQHEAIEHLASLRAGSNGQAKTNSYGMPTAGWFKYVSCPHYFAELMIYFSFLLIGGTSGGGLGQGYLLALIFVFTNQALVAGHTHAWYRRKFEDYPAERKRLIPGVW